VKLPQRRRTRARGIDQVNQAATQVDEVTPPGSRPAWFRETAHSDFKDFKSAA
jgi:hypothetical protein